MRELFSEYLLSTLNIIASFMGIKIFFELFYGQNALINSVIEGFINTII